MSDRPHGEDWWKASDGNWYPPEVRPGGAAPHRPGPAGESPPGAPAGDRSLSRGLTGTLRGLMLATGAAGPAAAIALVSEIGRLDAAAVRRADLISDALGSAAPFLSLFSIVALASAVVMIVWLHRAYSTAVRRGATGNAWSPGWAVGGWFIPLGNLVIPKLIFNEVERLSHPDAGPEPILDRWRDKPTMAVGHLWWGLLLVSAVVFAAGYGIIVEQIDSLSPDIEVFRRGLWVMAAGLAASGAAGVTGAALVHAVGRRFTG
jgi:hypothetical protein